MSSPHILIVEDEENLSQTLALNFKIEQYQVSIARSGSEALQIFGKKGRLFDLVLLDVMLPDVNGFELCRKFKEEHPTLPVIFLTAKNQVIDKIEGLKLGADDYITKPFDLEEVLLRISNLLKRTQKVPEAQFDFIHGRINFQTFEITDVRGNRHTLSRREMGLLELLTANTNKVISRDEILEKLWLPEENASARTIDNYILNFRKFFEPNVKAPIHFHSIRGVGYKFTV